MKIHDLYLALNGSRESGVPIKLDIVEKLIKAFDHAYATLETIAEDSSCTCELLHDQAKICTHCLAVEMIELLSIH